MQNSMDIFDLEMDNITRSCFEFSHDGFAVQEMRTALEKKYKSLLEISPDYNRQIVSFQLSKKSSIHSWLKYREGFSATLVESLLNKMKLKKGDTVLDPFLGSGTTSLVCQLHGINSIGYDILPTSAVAMEAKQNIYNYDIAELETFLKEIIELSVPENYSKRISSIKITEGAYPDQIDHDLAFYTEWVENSSFSNLTKNLAKLCILNSLEDLSYTTKDGQYLRWDCRSSKVKKKNEKRKLEGKPFLATKLNKGEFSNVIDSFVIRYNSILDEIKILQSERSLTNTDVKFIQNSSLFELPILKNNSISGVITSPPYCNRYDYTRTYALELVYLGLNDIGLKNLRQSLLSCTVENHPKHHLLKSFYESIGEKERFNQIITVISQNTVLSEIIDALEARSKNGDINNPGVIRMVKGYFTEMAFIIAELYRLCKPGAKVAIVNDNVRYGGEVIPVDFLSTLFAEQFGFTPVKIYTLKQKKGNSSQQMKKFGRVPLRKSITIWEK